MRIGKLNNLVTLNKDVIKKDEYGTPIGKEKKEIGKAWAHITNLHGKEYFEAYSLSLHKEVLFTIRFNPEMDESTVITFKGNDYIVSFVDNLKYKNKFMEIRATLKTR